MEPIHFYMTMNYKHDAPPELNLTALPYGTLSQYLVELALRQCDEPGQAPMNRIGVKVIFYK